MWEDLYKYLIVFGLSMLKFLAGLATGELLGLSTFLNATIAILGMMSSVMLFTSFLGKYFHEWIMKTFYKNSKLFTKNNRRKITIWNKYGLLGVAFLTPPIFTPIGGAMIANGFGESKQRIFFYMLMSAICWALAFAFLFSTIKDFIVSIFN